MSGVMKSFKKVWRPIEKLGSKITNVATLGLHNKTKKIRHKIIKSKAFKIVVAAAAIYFGGAALLSMAQGGTAAAGIGSAWGGVTGAGSALATGNFSGAASALGSGFTSGAAAGASGTFAAGQAAASGAISANAAGVAASAATAATQAAPALTAPAATTPASSGLWASLGEGGKAAVITSGVNMAGQMIQGRAADKAAEEEKSSRNYYGVDGNGNSAGFLTPGLLHPTTFQAPPPFQFQQTTPKTLDELIERQKKTVNNYPTWG